MVGNTIDIDDCRRYCVLLGFVYTYTVVLEAFFRGKVHDLQIPYFDIGQILLS